MCARCATDLRTRRTAFIAPLDVAPNPAILAPRLASLALEKASGHFGPFMGVLVGIDSPASNAQTCAALGWAPTEPGLLADLEAHYFGER